MAFPDHKSDGPAQNRRHITSVEGGTAVVGGGTPKTWNLYDRGGDMYTGFQSTWGFRVIIHL